MSEVGQLHRLPNFFIALFIYALINVLCALPHLLLSSNVIKSGNGVRQCIDSAIADYHHDIVAGNNQNMIVPMGSSLVMSALWSCDFAQSKQIPDFYHHHHAPVFEKTLHEAGVNSAHVFSFAIPGAMVSDVYLICDKLFAGKEKPSLIVYGVAPRDFVDDLLSSETRTPIFEKLSELSDLNKMSDLYMSSWQEKTDFLLSHIVFLYGTRVHDQQKFSEVCTRILSPILIGEARHEDNNVGVILLGDRKRQWSHSVDEYQRRYNHFNREEFNKQNNFLRALLKTAHDRQIAVLLVKMPLTPTNISLMQPGFYAQYSNNLGAIAKEYSVPLLDPSKEDDFSDETLFYDTVHLNARGGNKLIAVLTHWIANNGTNPMACMNTHKIGN